MKSDQMTFRCSDAFKGELDLIRKAESDLPSRTEMLHRLVDRAADTVTADLAKAKGA